MATKIVQGCVVSVPATYFDGHGAANGPSSSMETGGIQLGAVALCSVSFKEANGVA